MHGGTFGRWSKEGSGAVSCGARVEVRGCRMKPKVVVTEGLEKGPMAWLHEHAHTVEVSWKNTDAMFAALQDADAVIVRTYTIVTDGFLARCPKLKVVARAGVGLDNIDQRACERRGIAVLS